MDHSGNNTSEASPFYGIYLLEVTADTFFYLNVTNSQLRATVFLH